MENKANIKLFTVTLDSRESQALAQFYAALLGWEIPFADDVYIGVAAPGAALGAYPGITIQHNPAYQPPVWPQQPEAQQQMAHIDFAVADMEEAVQHALACGATRVAEQFSEHWTVMLDPSGHPFCLCKAAHIFASPDFALR